jgi:peptidoglycan/LPS O-acetylase OafA/YrhL
MPTSLVGFAGLASGRYLVLEIAILIMAGVIIVSLLLAVGMSRAIELPMDRWLARRACDWLEGRRIWPARGTSRGQVDFIRLYKLSEFGGPISDNL